LSLWAEPSQVALIREAVLRAGLTVTRAGCWSKGQSGAVASQLQASPVDDLRTLLGSVNGGAILIGSSGDFGSRPEDVRALVAARNRGVRVLCLEPLPQSYFDLVRLWRVDRDLEDEEGERIAAAQVLGLERSIRLLAMPTRSKAFAEASETLAAFGAPRSASLRVHARMGELSLASRLIAAFDLLGHVFPGEEHPAWIDAACVQRGHLHARAAAPPESLRHAEGDLVALVRFADGRAASVHVSDWASSSEFSLRLQSAQGVLRLDDRGHSWHAPDGTLRTEAHVAQSREDGASSTAQRLGEELDAAIDPASSDAGPITLDRPLIAAQTALLSAHTGHPESPSAIIEMAKRLDP
jgi:hypothetical protein